MKKISFSFCFSIGLLHLLLLVVCVGLVGSTLVSCRRVEAQSPSTQGKRPNRMAGDACPARYDLEAIPQGLARGAIFGQWRTRHLAAAAQ